MRIEQNFSLPGCPLPDVYTSGCHTLGEEKRPDEADAPSELATDLDSYRNPH